MESLICIDSACLRNPVEFGLPADLLDAEVRRVATLGDDARNMAKELAEGSLVVVISSDDVDAINLAGMLKAENPHLRVWLVTNEISGSMQSRMDACKIDKLVLSQDLDLALRDASDTFSTDPVEFDDYEIYEEETPTSLAKNAPGKIQKSNANCWVCSIFSGSGGAGKSCVSAVMAQLLADVGFKTLLIDADFQFGDLAFCFRFSSPVAFDSVFSSAGVNVEALEKSDSNLVVLAAPTRLESCELGAKNLEKLIEVAAASFDAIIVNTGSNWGDCHATLLRISSCSLFIVDQRVSSVRGCLHAVELAERLNVPTSSFKFALNRCKRRSTISPADAMASLKCDDLSEFKEGTLDIEEKMCCACVDDLIKHKNPFAMSVFEFLEKNCPLNSEASTSKAKISRRKK
ncbi:MAG: AAA family ATPase [Phoenicibacter congonensis]|uniref:AAA family ATPase n=1 Tax=Phoenicibacter congonensis TaxID=1944646 RepID=A0AA43RIJ3_9ACTN|nr:AAA family ATPase [Phoenicibacter congonensis]